MMTSGRSPHPEAAAAPRPRRLRVDGPELVILLSACMGLSALSIDLLLPAFGDMRGDFGLAADSSRISLVITAYFLGLGAGQIAYGPLSDRFGRRPTMYVGLGLFVVASFGAIFSPNLTVLLAWRFVWGLGAAAPRSIAFAVARDSFEGHRLARTMSLIMTIYILVPIVAPALGVVLLEVVSWRALIAVQMAAGLGVILWLTRLPETLAEENRRSASIRSLGAAAGAVLRSRVAVGYGLAVAFVQSVLLSYIGSIELIIDEVFGQRRNFALLFAAAAVALAFGSFSGSRLVGRFGVHKLVRIAVLGISSSAVALVTLARGTDGMPPLWAFLGVLVVLLFFATLMVPSANAAAMQPLGHVAGMAAALLGTVSTLIGALLGAVTDRSFDGTITPFGEHLLVYAVLAAASVLLIAGPANRAEVARARRDVVAAVPEPA